MHYSTAKPYTVSFEKRYCAFTFASLNVPHESASSPCSVLRFRTPFAFRTVSSRRRTLAGLCRSAGFAPSRLRNAMRPHRESDTRTRNVLLEYLSVSPDTPLGTRVRLRRCGRFPLPRRRLARTPGGSDRKVGVRTRGTQGVGYPRRCPPTPPRFVSRRRSAPGESRPHRLPVPGEHSSPAALADRRSPPWATCECALAICDDIAFPMRHLAAGLPLAVPQTALAAWLATVRRDK